MLLAKRQCKFLFHTPLSPANHTPQILQISTELTFFTKYRVFIYTPHIKISARCKNLTVAFTIGIAGFKTGRRRVKYSPPHRCPSYPLSSAVVCCRQLLPPAAVASKRCPLPPPLPTCSIVLPHHRCLLSIISLHQRCFFRPSAAVCRPLHAPCNCRCLCQPLCSVT